MGNVLTVSRPSNIGPDYAVSAGAFPFGAIVSKDTDGKLVLTADDATVAAGISQSTIETADIGDQAHFLPACDELVFEMRFTGTWNDNLVGSFCAIKVAGTVQTVEVDKDDADLFRIVALVSNTATDKRVRVCIPSSKSQARGVEV